MRTLILSLVFFLSTVGVAHTQTPSGAWADKLFAGKLTHDFKTVPHGAQLKWTFEMTNIWKVPLDITEVRVSCGCTTATATVKHLEPNGTGKIEVNMDGTRFTGPKSVSIYVTVGPEFVSTATLTVTANARQDVVFNPGEIDFGPVQRGQNLAKTIDVEYAGTFDWRVNEIVKSASALFELKVDELAEKPPIRGYRITATLKSDAQAGPFKQEILLKTNDPVTPLLTFNVLGNVQATLTVTPQSIALAGKVGEMQTKKIVVRGARPFRILGADGQADGVTVGALPSQADTTHVIEIRFQATKLGDLRKILTLRTDLDNERATVEVDVNGMP